MGNELRRSWLLHWHSVIDQAFGPDPSFHIESAYEDPSGDFRMHFMTWDLPDDLLLRCFEMLPRGDEVCRRAIEMRNLYRSGPVKVAESEALQLFQKGLDGLAQFVDDDDLRKPIRVVRGPSDELQMIEADRVAVVLEQVDWSGHFDGEIGAAASFLHETLYRLANSYEVADYIDWPLCPDPNSIDPHRGFALLVLSFTYYPLLDAEGPVLFTIED